MFRFPDWCYRKIPSSAWLWFAVWIIWYCVLWTLSGSNPKIENAPKIPHFDKVLHFGYYMIGGFCFANGLKLKSILPWKTILLIAVIAGAIVGASDEYHQSFTPGRSGNDFGDWIADVSGTLAGALYCYFMWKRFTLEQTSELN